MRGAGGLLVLWALGLGVAAGWSEAEYPVCCEAETWLACGSEEEARQRNCSRRPRVGRLSYRLGASLAPETSALALWLHCAPPPGLSSHQPLFTFGRTGKHHNLTLHTDGRLLGPVSSQYLDSELWCWYRAGGRLYYSPTGYMMRQCRHGDFQTKQGPEYCWGKAGPGTEEGRAEEVRLVLDGAAKGYRWHWEAQWFMGLPLCSHSVQAYNRLVPPQRRALPPHFLCCLQSDPVKIPQQLQDPPTGTPADAPVCSRSTLRTKGCGGCNASFPDAEGQKKERYWLKLSNESHMSIYRVGVLSCGCTIKSANADESRELLKRLEEGSERWPAFRDPLQRYAVRKEALGRLGGRWKETSTSLGPLCSLSAEKPPLRAVRCGHPAALRRLFRFRASPPQPCHLDRPDARLKLSVLPKSSLNEDVDCLLGVAPERGRHSSPRDLSPPLDGLPKIHGPFRTLSARIRTGTGYRVRDCDDVSDGREPCWLSHPEHPHWIFLVRKEPSAVFRVLGDEEKYGRLWAGERGEGWLGAGRARRTLVDGTRIRSPLSDALRSEAAEALGVALAALAALVLFAALALLLLCLEQRQRRLRLPLDEGLGRRVDGSAEDEDDVSLVSVLRDSTHDDPTTATDSD